MQKSKDQATNKMQKSKVKERVSNKMHKSKEQATTLSLTIKTMQKSKDQATNKMQKSKEHLTGFSIYVNNAPIEWFSKK